VWYLFMTVLLSYPQSLIEKKFSRTRARVRQEPALVLPSEPMGDAK
jgi:polar amino acid transport system permease protein